MNIRSLCLSASLAALLVASTLPAEAQQAGHKGGDPQAMQAREFRNLQQGRGMGMGRVAELNGYPGPKHVLEHAEALELSEGQIERSREIMSRVKSRAPELGKQVVDAEKQLEAMFAEDNVDAASMDSLLMQIAELRAQLRSLHLTAHLDQAAVLTEAQITKYTELRSASRADDERRPMRRMREMKRKSSSDGDDG